MLSGPKKVMKGGIVGSLLGAGSCAIIVAIMVVVLRCEGPRYVGEVEYPSKLTRTWLSKQDQALLSSLVVGYKCTHLGFSLRRHFSQNCRK